MASQTLTPNTKPVKDEDLDLSTGTTPGRPMALNPLTDPVVLELAKELKQKPGGMHPDSVYKFLAQRSKAA